MKVRIAILVLTGILCVAATARSDTIAGHARDVAVLTMESGGFDFHNALPSADLRSTFVESDKFELIDPQPEHERWEGRHRHRLDSGDPSSTTTPTTPVAAAEPSTLSMLALGLIGLLGAALFGSRPRSGTL